MPRRSILENIGFVDAARGRLIGNAHTLCVIPIHDVQILVEVLMSDAPETAADTAPVFRLIYNSHSRIAPDQSTFELGAIFTTARRNNRRLGITGALVVTGDAFVQALEGDESAVRNLYADICRDARHEGATVLEEAFVDARTFGRWAMAKVAEEGGPDIRLLSNATRGKIVAAGTDHHVTPEQEQLLMLMRRSLTEGAPAA
jgi:hypothetical protein